MAVGDILTGTAVGAGAAVWTVAMWAAIIFTFIGAIMLAYGVFLLVTGGDRTTGISLVSSGVFLIIVTWAVKYFLNM